MTYETVKIVGYHNLGKLILPVIEVTVTPDYRYFAQPKLLALASDGDEKAKAELKRRDAIIAAREKGP